VIQETDYIWCGDNLHPGKWKVVIRGRQLQNRVLRGTKKNIREYSGNNKL
jgi:hypothetical protein